MTNRSAQPSTSDVDEVIADEDVLEEPWEQGSDEAETAKNVVPKVPAAAEPEVAPRPSVRPPPVTRVLGAIPAADSAKTASPLLTELERRASRLEGGDPVAIARAQMELGLVREVIQRDRDAALGAYRAAYSATPSSVGPITAARWCTPQRPVGPALSLAKAHLAVASDDTARAERLVELARLQQASGALDLARESFRQALSLQPAHPSALRGLESVLGALGRRGAKEPVEALAAHLEHMASAWQAEPKLSAWLHVERAALLDKLGRTDAARAALRAAIKLDGESSTVRDAFTRHLLVHRAIEELVDAWDVQAGLESDDQAARLELSAGRLASERLDDAHRAIDLFERAARRPGAEGSVRRTALRELSRVRERVGQLGAATQARRAHLELVDDPVLKVHEHRCLAQLFELLDDPPAAVLHAEQVLAAEPEDRETRERLDRMLERAGRHEKRIALWTSEASRTSDRSEQAACFLRAAEIAEIDIRNPNLTVAMLRAAWAADPANVDAFDGLSRLLTPPNSSDQQIPDTIRKRLDLYEQAALTAGDKERRLAHLEKVALIWEEELRRPERALEQYRRMSELDPGRRSTWLGIQRTAGRANEPALLIRALVAEADLTRDTSLQATLLLRAARQSAEVLGDLDTAMGLIGKLLAKSPGNRRAIRAAWDVNYRAGRYENALAQLRLLVDPARKSESLALNLEIAVLLEERLRRPAEAIQAYREANRIDPDHPVPRVEIARLHESTGQYRAAADELIAMAAKASSPATRAALLLQAAELFEDRLDDLEAAAAALTQANALTPADSMVFERLSRVQLRRGKPGELIALLDARVAKLKGAEQRRLQLRLAWLLADERDYARAAELLREVLKHDPTHVAARRLRERSLRNLERSDDLCRELLQQASVAQLLEVKLSALHEVHYLEEHAGAARAEAPGVVERILELAPDNQFAHEALVRSSGLSVKDVAIAVRVANSVAVIADVPGIDPHSSASLHLGAGLMFERSSAEQGDEVLHAAMIHYRAALAAWPECLSAARGLRAVAEHLGDTRAHLAAHDALGKIESEPSVRAQHLVAAAQLIADGSGKPAEAVELLAQALRDDPESESASKLLGRLLDQGADAARILDIMRVALEVSKSPSQVALLGCTIGRIARDVLHDPTVALEALRKVKVRSPIHVPGLLMLADTCLQLHLWAEAADAARAARGVARPPEDRVAATLALSDALARSISTVHEAKQLASEAERLLDSSPIVDRVAVFERLAEIYRTAGEATETERLQCMMVVAGAGRPEPLRKLAAQYPMDSVDGTIAYLRVLSRVLATADVLGVAYDPGWLVEIGRLEATVLGRAREGTAKLRQAVQIDPARIASHAALAETLSGIGAHGEAADELRGALETIPPERLQTRDVATLLSALVRELNAAGMRANGGVVEQILAYFGYGAPERIGVIQGHTTPDNAPVAMSLDRAVLERAVLPIDATGPALLLNTALEEVVAKVLRVEPGFALRDKLRAGANHPLRALADRVARAFGPVVFDLYADVIGLPLPRVLPGDPAQVVLPAGYERLAPAEQMAGLGRMIAMVALGVPWLEELSDDDLDGWMFGSLQVGRNDWGAGKLSPSQDAMAELWRPRVAKAASRKLRRRLEELADGIAIELRPGAFRRAMRQSVWRCGFLCTGDWTATCNHVWRTETKLQRAAPEQLGSIMMGHELMRDLILYAASPDPVALLRNAGHVAR